MCSSQPVACRLVRCWLSPKEIEAKAGANQNRDFELESACLQAVRLRQSGNDYRHVLYPRADRRAFFARDEGKTAARSRRIIAASPRKVSAAQADDDIVLSDVSDPYAN